MFAPVSTLLALVLAATVGASVLPVPRGYSGGGSPPPAQGSCSTGPVQCCNTLVDPAKPGGAMLSGLLDIALQGLDGYIGLNCDPIPIIAIAGNGCASTPVCCQDNSSGNVINVGCVPVVIPIAGL